MIFHKIKGLGATIGFSAAIIAVAGLALHFGANRAPVQAAGNTAAPSATFNADVASLGSIPDGTSLTPCSSVTPKNVTFTVSGLSGAPSNVEVNMTAAAPVHTFSGDLIATLIAPNGTSFVVFGRTGATSAGSFGSASDFAGPYSFKDSAAGTNWWTAAASTPIPSGSYRTTTPGPTTSPAAVTTMSPAFAGVTNPNGTWTLRFQDCASGDTGSISAASLVLDTAAAPTQHVLDYDGDGKTDRVVTRNTGGGANGQLTWFINFSSNGGTNAYLWGLANDFKIAGDYDGDQKTDIAVWRPISTGQPSGNAFFYILQSLTNTVRIEDFGQTGDDPTVAGDYNGDGKTDFAVYRAGASAGLQSTWFYRTTTGGPITYQGWGMNGDFPAPGDYDGDGKADFVIQRNNGGGQAKFWMLQTTAGIDNSIVFGTPTDVIVPGDYDGDGKTDIATIRGSAGQILWFVRPSSTGVISAAPFATLGASASDFPVQGDYDGDGKTDPAIWRPSTTPGASAFWWLGSTSGGASVQFGQNGDYPVANFNTH